MAWGEAQLELKEERNNNTSVFQTFLYTRYCSMHVTYINSVNPLFSETFTIIVSILWMRTVESREVKPLIQGQPAEPGF